MENIRYKINLWVKRIYVIVFNLYSWFWLYRLIFICKSTNLEDYFLWVLAVAGMHFFVLDNTDILFKTKK